MTKKTVPQNCCLVAILCFFIISLSFGSTQAAELRVLSLDQLVEMALQTSPELKMAEQDILAAKSEYKEAKGGQLPQFDLMAITGPVENARFPTVIVSGPNAGTIVQHDAGMWDVGIF